MRAIIARSFGGPEVLCLETTDDPVPGQGEVVIDVDAVGINPFDAYMRSGAYMILPDLPYTPGGDAAGRVSAVGAGVTGFAPGDRVFVCAALGLNLTGCYAEKVKRPAGDVIRLPDGVSSRAGAALGVPYVTAQYALFQRGRAKPGECVFIHGASGAVGLAAVQLARRAGLRVIGSAGSPEGAALVAAQGAELVVNHSRQGYLEALAGFDGGAPDLVLEMLANVNLAADMDLVRKFGRIVIVGSRGPIEIQPRAAMMKELDVLGMAIWNAGRGQVEAALGHVLDAVADGLQPVLERSLPLAEAADAHRAVLDRKSGGKIVLETRNRAD